MTTKKSDADTLWDELKNVRLELYGLPSQSIEVLYDRLPVDPNTLHLKLKNARATATISALEEVLNPGDPKNHRFDVISAELGLIVISKKADISDAVRKFDEQKELARQEALAAKKTKIVKE